jgi:glycosyltransferase involved in cell wall biosynthesis
LTSLGFGKDDFVSVIIPTFNSASSLRGCLDSVNHQHYPRFEVIVVDNYSCDETCKIAESFGAKVILHRGTQAAARNVGIANSKGHFVLLLDSDQQLDDGVIDCCVSLCTEFNVDAVKISEVFGGSDFWGRCSGLWKNSMVRAAGLNGGIPRFYRKELIVKRLAFSSKMRWWEDLELYERLKLAGLKESWCRSKIFHYEGDSPRKIVRKYFSYGQSISEFEDSPVSTPYVATLSLSLSTAVQVVKESGKSLRVFVGCCFLVVLKSFCAALGFVFR